VHWRGHGVAALRHASPGINGKRVQRHAQTQRGHVHHDHGHIPYLCRLEYEDRCYAGLSGFSSQDGGLARFWTGGSLLVAAAFYYDDPQYRWFVRNRNLRLGSEAAYPYGMHSPYDAVGPIEAPTRYCGVHALPFDERIYNVLNTPQAPGRNEALLRQSPNPLDKAIDSRLVPRRVRDQRRLSLPGRQPEHGLPLPGPEQCHRAVHGLEGHLAVHQHVRWHNLVAERG